MMNVSLPYVVIIPLAVNLFAVFLFWFFYGVRDRVRSPSSAHARIYRCSVCRHVYVDSRDVPLARCPRCACLNEAVKR